jgi:hypothetical protein
MASTITVPGDNFLTETDVVTAITAAKADIEDGGMLTATVAAAGAGSVLTDAAQIDYGFTLATGADDTVGVKLPPAVAGKVCVIKVADGADLKVWPSTGDAINAIAAGSAMTVVDDVCFMLVAYDSTTWYTIPLLPS